MNTIFRKISVIVEVILVTFILVPSITLTIYRLFPRFENWQTHSLDFPVPPFIYLMEMGIPILIILLHRGNLAEYGLRFDRVRYQLDVATACIFPVALSWIPIAMGVDYTSWGGAAILAVTQVALLYVLGVNLRKKLPIAAIGAASALVFLVPAGFSNDSGLFGKAIATFLFYGLFVGFGEEILFRGYMQSRLNEVFGKPYQFFQVPYGWGAIITAVLFGLMHVGVFRWILGMSTEVTLAWGVWTMVAGLVFSLVREKSGGILAPALLHGLPQAIAFTMMLFFPFVSLG